MNVSRYSIEAKGLAKQFNRNLLFKNINFTVNTGNFFCITGKNGSGKSTLLKILAGLMEPSAGSVLYTKLESGSPLKEWKPYTGYTGPLVNPYEDLSARENLNFVSKDRSPKSQIDLLIKRFNLSEHEDKKVKYYSSGMKQRLRIILAELNDPPFLLLDEPGTNLDASARAILYSYLVSVKMKKIIILATNDRDEEKLCGGGILLGQ